METKNIYKKLFNLQNKVGAISKDSTNPFFKSKYFDINKLIEVLKPLLEEEGLLLLQPIEMTEISRVLTTKVIDIETGEQVVSTTNLPDNPDPQKMGSIITYFRRYSLQSLLALQAEDDDANSPSGNTIPNTDVPF